MRCCTRTQNLRSSHEIQEGHYTALLRSQYLLWFFNTITTLLCPEKRANTTGVNPFTSSTSSFADGRERMYVTTSVNPCKQAMCNGVHPKQSLSFTNEPPCFVERN
ncbi:unnamed protein product [Albugo candida]|uniref:Uncharacterized protein n=1 Tax=Albugo candida TaxID=65357 RepID=A0A024G6Q4_9STRA|nr:unnamed protein product [Albugo candida]|eukprot:CCI41990.1 unnamed protein product [Albugo candida]